MEKRIEIEQLRDMVGMSFEEVAYFVLQRVVGCDNLAEQCCNAYKDIEPTLLQLDDGLFVLDLTELATGSFHDWATTFFVQRSSTDRFFSMCPDIAASLGFYGTKDITFVWPGSVSSDLRRLQLTTTQKIKVIGIKDASVQDIEFVFGDNGVDLVDCNQEFVYAHCTWMVYVCTQLLDDYTDEIVLFLPHYSDIAKKASDMATKLGLPIKVRFGDSQLYDSVDSCINQFYDEYGVVPSPECAMSYVTYKNFAQDNPNSLCVVVATQSPFKYTQDVLKALGKKPTFRASNDIKQLFNLTALPIPQAFIKAATKTSRPTVELDIDRLIKELE